jgi:hypothetical protein
MAYTAPTVNYSATINGTYTALTGVQTVSISRGRQRFQDNLPQTSCTIELIPAATYAVPFAIGQFVDIRDTNSSSSPCYFAGVITDIDRQYSIPYNSVSGYAPGDRITISATGAIGAMGKTSLDSYSVSDVEVIGSIFNAAAANGIYVGYQINNAIRNSAISFTGGLLDLTNDLLRTSQYMIDDIDTKRVAYLTNNYATNQYPPGQGGNATKYKFSDTGAASTYKFSDLQYLSSVQSAFTQVQVAAEGLATQTASSGTAPFNTLVYNSLNFSTADALSLANYVLAVQSLATVTPYSITTNTKVADDCINLAKIATSDIYAGGDRRMPLGATFEIAFRGTTVTAQVQGINTTFYPDYATVQLFLSPSLGVAFTLDSTVSGILDTNRLGYP